MNHRMNFMAAIACVAVLTGCDWGGVDSDESWNDSCSWLNFSGTYQLSDAGKIPGGAGATGVKTVSKKFSGDRMAGMPGVVSDIGSGIVPGSVTIAVTDAHSNYTLEDNGQGAVAGEGGTSGTINYLTGAWSVNLGGEKVDNPTVAVTYSFNGGTSGSDAGISITFLHVTQKGNLLTMRDSNGTTYSGRITGASTPKDGSMAAQDVRVSFEVASASGVKIVGHFSGDWSGAPAGAAGVLSNRLISATISNGNGHDDVHGVASAISLKSPSAPTQPNGNDE